MTPVVRLDPSGPPVLTYRPPHMDEVVWWQRTIHAEVARKFGAPFDGWRWPRYAGLCLNVPRANPVSSEMARRMNFTYHGVGVFHRDEPTQPLALAIYLPNTKNLRPGGPGILYLEWLSARPAGTHGYGKTVGFGRYLMDWLILQSLEAGLDGRLSLHAATEGLRPVYEGWGFERIGEAVPLIRNRRNNGLFYELQPQAALAFRQRLDHLR